jgi:hypothetical protein
LKIFAVVRRYVGLARSKGLTKDDAAILREFAAVGVTPR